MSEQQTSTQPPNQNIPYDRSTVYGNPNKVLNKDIPNSNGINTNHSTSNSEEDQMRKVEKEEGEDNDTLLKRLEEANKQLDEYAQEFIKHENQRSVFQSLIKELQSKVDIMQKKIETFQHLHNKSEKEFSELKRKELEDEKRRLDEEYTRELKIKRVEEVQKSNKKIISELWKADFEMKNTKLLQLNEELVKELNDKTALLKETKRLNNTVDELRRQIVDLKKDKIDMTAQVCALKSGHNKAENASEFNNLKKEYEEINKTWDEEREKLIKKCNDLEKAVESLKITNEKNLKVIDTLQQENDRVKAVVNTNVEQNKQYMRGLCTHEDCLMLFEDEETTDDESTQQQEMKNISKNIQSLLDSNRDTFNKKSLEEVKEDNVKLVGVVSSCLMRVIMIRRDLEGKIGVGKENEELHKKVAMLEEKVQKSEMEYQKLFKFSKKHNAEYKEFIDMKTKMEDAQEECVVTMARKEILEKEFYDERRRNATLLEACVKFIENNKFLVEVVKRKMNTPGDKNELGEMLKAFNNYIDQQLAEKMLEMKEKQDTTTITEANAEILLRSEEIEKQYNTIKDEVNELREENDLLRKAVDDLEDEKLDNHEVEDELEIQLKKNKELQSEIEWLKKKIAVREKLDEKKKLEKQNEDAGLKEKVENITQENEKLKKCVEENEKEKERITQQIQGLEGERETYKQLVEKKEIDIQNLLTENAKKTTPGEQGKTIDVDEYNVVVAEKEKIKTNMEKMREGIYRELNKLQTQNQQITQELLGGLEQIKQSTKVLIDENKRARWILDLLKTDEKEKKTN